MHEPMRTSGRKITIADLDDVFAIQSEIAKAIADQLQANCHRARRSAIERAPTADVAAFDLYSRAKNLILRHKL